ncbi:aromatic ring-hydroxylating oxygenase subunit alpha [Rhodopila globiformis]|uniref:Rieske (2Fe-2S) protein n=1 Tax=Rhodopila globiformis TaxID=1071 RepID=A0A2S6N6Y6_RHOGL|nr:Rieske 2Fe-2S domain-containing protein [Rhodopila globiformis]PPQ30364.1 Rieske (2Fe-2S) protein [Rhodopila globiformis]
MDQPVRDLPVGAWPPGLTRVPYWVYRDPGIARAEQARLFEGPCWHFLCLEIDVPNPGDYRTTMMGAMPVVVARAEDGAVVAFENRCAHRGALICLDDGGSVKDFQCIYHAWRYDLHGNLKSVAFRHGVGGKGGMPDDFRPEAHGPRKLHVTVQSGLVFGTLVPDGPSFEDTIGSEILARLQRVLHKKLEIIGRFTQQLPCNWKLYMENVRDTYHASLLHTFFTTFRITRLSHGGGVMVSDNGVAHASTTLAPPQGPDTTYAGMRADNEGFRLQDPSFMRSVAEFNDDISLQILSIFPGFVLQQINNTLAVRQIVPRGIDSMDLHWTYLGFADDTPDLRAMRLKQANLAGPAGYVSMEDGAVGGFVQRGIAAAEAETSVVEMGGTSADTTDTRATEASVRGFWKAWRARMGL